VTVSGSEAIDLAGLTFITSGFTTPEVAPTFATEATGGAGSVDEYSGAAGPFSFGSGVFTSATTGAGDLVGVQALQGEPSGFIFVPMGYASGAPLSDTATYAGQSFATLGLAPGVYRYNRLGFGRGHFHGRGRRPSPRTIDLGHDAGRLRRARLCGLSQS
jgi:hypothetical protein